MTEELRVKVIVDTSQVKASVNQAKQSIKGIGNTKVNGDGQKTHKQTQQLNADMTKLQAIMQKIAGINVFGVFNNIDFDKIRKDIILNQKAMKHYADEVKRYKQIIKSYFEKDGIIRVDADQVFSGLTNKKWLKDLIGKDSMKGFTKEAFKDLKVDFKSLGKDIKGLFGNIGGMAKASLGIIKSQLVGILGVLTAIVAVLVGLTKNAIAVAKQMRVIHTEAHKIGMSVGSYQKWSYILEQVGGEAQDLTDFIKTLSSEQVKLREGNKDTAKSFEKLGISADKAMNMNQEELLEETVRGLANVENQVERTAMAYKIFGEEDASKLTNILSLNNKELETLAHNYEILGGYASQTLITRSDELTQATQNLKVAWQGIRNVLAEAVLPAINAVVRGLVRITAVIRMVLAVLFNTDKTVAGSAQKSINKAKQSIDNYTGSVNNASKAVEEFKRTTMGFDELNIVDDPNKSYGSSGIGSIAMPEIPTIDPGEIIPDEMDSLIPDTEDLGLDKVASFIDKYKNKIEDYMTVFLTFAGVVLLIAGACMGIIPLAIAGAGLAGLGIWVGAGEGGSWDRWGQKIKEVCGNIKNWFKDLWENIKEGAKICWTSIKEWFKDTWVSLKEWAGDAWTAIKEWSSETWENIKEGATVCWTNVKQYALEAWDHIKIAWANCKEFFAEKWESIKIIWKNAPDFFKKKWKEIKEDLTELKDTMAEKFKEAWDKVKSIWNTAKSYFNDIWSQVKQVFYNVPVYFKEKFNGAWIGIKSAFGNFTEHFKEKWAQVKENFTDVGDYFEEKFQDAWERIKNVFSGWKEFFTGLWDKIKGVFTNAGTSIAEGLGGAVKRVINGVLYNIQRTINSLISMLNGAIYWINRIPGVNVSRISPITVPRLATGGIATKSTLANIGENGKEAVLPLENNTQWMDKLADKINSRNGSAPAKVVLTIDGRELGWATINNINAITKQTGGLQLAL